MTAEHKIPEKEILELVGQLQQAAGPNLLSVILYGSGATNEFISDYSDVNLLCVLRETSFPALEALGPVVKSWVQQKRRAPLLMSRDELERSTDVFSIEMLDMQKNHRMLHGEDLLMSLTIPMHWHRAQLEYELGEKLILLRQRLLMSMAAEKDMWDLLLHSVPAFATLFRHALIAQNLTVPSGKREVVRALAAKAGFDPSTFERLLDIREHRAEPRQFQVRDIASRYLADIEKVIGTIDKLSDSSGPRGL